MPKDCKSIYKCFIKSSSNVNIPWPYGGFGDQDYLHVFDRIISPILNEFEPEFILVSCGFDAAFSDPIGGCMVTPNGYAKMTSILKRFAGGKVVLALEGGYNLQVIRDCAVECSKVLLGCDIPIIREGDKYWGVGGSRGISFECMQVVRQVLDVQGKYWNG